MTISIDSFNLLDAPSPGHFRLPRPEPLVPRLPEGLTRTPTVAPRLVAREQVPMPAERLRGPAELEFGDVDGAWFREGMSEDLPLILVERAAGLPWWAFAVPVVAAFGSITSSIALLVLLVR